jgi:hypothetical protein
MAEWIKFDGSEEHKKMMHEAELGSLLLKRKVGADQNSVAYDAIDSFLICEPHPHRDMIIEWANTGRPVYYFNRSKMEWELIDHPEWWEGDEYSFDPPKPKIRYRVALLINDVGELSTDTANSDDDEIRIAKSPWFVKWLTDWIGVEA